MNTNVNTYQSASIGPIATKIMPGGLRCTDSWWRNNSPAAV